MEDASLDEFLEPSDADDADDEQASGDPDEEPADPGTGSPDEADAGAAGSGGGEPTSAEPDRVGSDTAGEDEGEGIPEAEANADAAVRDPDTVDPAASTYAWSAEPVECPACGGRVSQQWRDGDTFVCADCKEW